MTITKTEKFKVQVGWNFVRQTVKLQRKLKLDIGNQKSKGWKKKYVLKFVEVKKTFILCTVHLNLNCESLDENET